MPNYAEIINQWSHLRVLAVGDVMLDQYICGEVRRVSPEAPVPVLHAQGREERLGGAASVACLTAALGAETWLCGVTGIDAAGDNLRRLLAQQDIQAEFLALDTRRPTTTKLRLQGGVGSRGRQHLLRVDEESTMTISPGIQQRLLDRITTADVVFDVLLISDYRKGVCSEGLLAGLIRWAKARNMPVLVDPANSVHWQHYAGADVITPNRHEAAQFAGLPVDSLEAASAAATTILQQLAIGHCLVTLDAQGVLLAGRDGGNRHFPCAPRQVQDVTGAGDMVLAVLGLCAATRRPWPEAIRLANAAAGWQVEQWGVAPLSPGRLLQELEPDPGPEHGKLLSLEELRPVLQAERDRGRSVVFTNGCFDLFHPGHLHCLQEAARQGDVLVVALNDDASIQRLKGPSRPVISQRHRAEMLCALECVDHVLIWEEDTPHRLLETLHPDVLVKGGTTPEIVGAELLDRWGGTFYQTSALQGLSTTSLTTRAASLNAQPAG